MLYKAEREREPAAESDVLVTAKGCRVQSSDRALGCEKGKSRLRHFHSSAASVPSRYLQAKQQTLQTRTLQHSSCTVWMEKHSRRPTFLFPAESVSVEDDERGGSEVCVRPRLHHLSAPSASPLRPSSGCRRCQQPAGAGDALPGLRTQEGKTQHKQHRRFIRSLIRFHLFTCLCAHFDFFSGRFK